MKLPELHLFDKKEKPQYFLAFILRDEKAIAVIFQELYQKAKIIGKGEEHFTSSVEEATDEEFLDVCDKAISKAEDVLPPGVETQKTIFGLKDEWISEEKIKKEYLEKLKKLSSELGLTPIGFLQTSEAILNLLKNEEGAPVTAILVEFLKDFVIVSVVKAGKVVESKGAQLSETEALTVENLLKHFQALEILPSRILLYGGNSEKFLQQFLSHQWSKSLNFLHLPQAISLPDDLDVKGILFGAATQLGFSVMADFIKKEAKEEIKEELAVSEDTEETVEEPESKAMEGETEIVTEPEEAFGFLEGGDVAKEKAPKASEEELTEEAETLEVSSSVKDTEDKERLDEKEEIEHTPEQSLEQEEEPRIRGRKRGSQFPAVLGKTRSFVSPVLGYSKKGLSLLNGFKGKKIIVIPVLAIILIIVLYVFYVFTVSANVVLTLEPKTEEQKQTVTFVEGGQTNAENSEIAALISSVTEDGNSETKATGKKDTGTKAKGSVTVCSRYTDDRTLPSGTVITSSNNLSFVTENSAKIASASADASADCSKATISVAAKEFGKEYNLPAGTKFSVGNFTASDIIAKNDNPFSGGIKKEIVVISKDDLSKAQGDLIKSLQDKAKEDLATKIPNDKVLLPLLINPEINDSSTNKKVGDESSTLSIKGTVSYDGVVYSKKDLIDFAKALFKNKLSDNQTINDKSISVDVEDIKDEDGNLVADLNFKVALLPKIENKDLAAKVSGMELNEAINYFSKLPQVNDVKINITPNIPFLTKSLPRASGNINIQTK
ncbi:MAG: hypothetical protein A2W22_04880 [Candidatus Levybacteria bacterium RBG_16_35_11]|nr:MAG: hypothetical protein A2W22_04880 [Candidatus Levybacteria bacterium RBG_16_35_11]